MIVGLFYKDRDWGDETPYFDKESIIKDLDLRILFNACGKEIEYEKNGQVKKTNEADLTIVRTMEKIMLVPVTDPATIRYRQEIIEDCIADREFIKGLYEFSGQVLDEWRNLGKDTGLKSGKFNSPGALMSQMKVLRLFLDSLGYLKRLLKSKEGILKAEAFTRLRNRLYQILDEEYEAKLRRILDDLAFYSGDNGTMAENGKYKAKPKMQFEVRLDSGFKFADYKLLNIETMPVRNYSKNNPIGGLMKMVEKKNPDAIDCGVDSGIEEEVDNLTYHTVSFIVSAMGPFLNDYKDFFDQLYLAAGFYLGASYLTDHLKRLNIPYCMPVVGKEHCLHYKNLKECITAIGQKIKVVGNDGDVEDKNLMIITGANQGGKSTFLRSVGIAQVLLQAGFYVTAESFESGLYPDFFTHFTRREDSQMNSGRLDEELARMSQIVDHLGPHSIVLLNESFATTTEKEGSLIAYDIIRALQEKGVMLLTVTHLLGFARTMYADKERMPKMQFLSAERLENGTRTFRMIPSEPALSSFGLELYEEILGK